MLSLLETGLYKVWEKFQLQWQFGTTSEVMYRRQLNSAMQHMYENLQQQKELEITQKEKP